MELVGGLVAAIVAELSIGGVATSHCEAVEALNLSAGSPAFLPLLLCFEQHHPLALVLTALHRLQEFRLPGLISSTVLLFPPKV